ncbi:hypothetical protein, partial [Streptomyces albogriseolus]|uniref:hypothetical protein n=1 Tax=Streptomyces albogriseolus TaxID=1887 RepID=UPI003460C8A1
MLADPAQHHLLLNVPVAEVLLVHGERAFEHLSRDGFAARLYTLDKPVIEAAVSHLSLLGFLADRPSALSVLESLPALAEALRVHRYDLTVSEYGTIFGERLGVLFSSDPGLVARVFSSVDVLRTVIAAPALAPVLAVPAVEELLQGREDVRRLIQHQPVIGEVVAGHHEDWVPALRVRELVKVLAADPAVGDLLRQHPFLLSAVRRNRALLAVVGTDPGMREALRRNEVLTAELGARGLHHLRGRSELVGVLARTTAKLDGPMWRLVLSDTRLLHLLNTWTGLAERFLTEPGVVQWYQGDPDRFVETGRSLKARRPDASRLT